MKGFKKIISTTLAALLVAGSASLTFAKSYTDVKEDDKFDIEISILSDLGVILGTSENEFSPDKDVTREQMATLLFRLMLGRDDAGRENTTNFKDLYEPYYNGAISWANAAGLIKGVSDDRFNPTGGITKQDAMTMLIRALGQETATMNAGYPWSYISAANRLGLDKGLEDVGYTETLTRAETAKIIYNALVSDYIVTKNQNGNIVSVTTSIIEEVFGYDIVDATIVATNDYALVGETVLKNGYVTVLANDGGREFTMTVPSKSMNLIGSDNSNLGRTFKVIYKTENGKHTVLSSVMTTTTEKHSDVTVNKNGTVTIGDNVFTLVTKLSDELSTNANELMLYLMGVNGEMKLIENAAELEAVKGFIVVELMSNGGKVSTGIVKTYKMDTVKIDKNGGMNIADGKRADEISVQMPNGVKDGDVVLYRYDAMAGELEVSEILKAVSGTVVRMTEGTVTIGEKTYVLGHEKAGITAESVKKMLSLGEEVTVLVHGDNAVSVVKGVKAPDESKYLVSLSNAQLVYENGAFRYVMTAYVDGEVKNVYLKNSDAKNGNVYRYTVNDGTYDLVPIAVKDNTMLSGSGMFIQSEDELGFTVDASDGTAITFMGSHYVLSAGSGAYASSDGKPNVQFVTDENTVILVNKNGVISEIKGKYASSVIVNSGAKVVAVLDNEVGAVETLRYLYISDGSLGNYDANAQTVRVLSNNGKVFADGRVYTEYTVYSFADGKIVTMVSAEAELKVGVDYRLGKDGTVTGEKAEAMQSGKVNGYTAGTVTIGDATYTVSGSTKIAVLTEDGKVGTSTVAELYGKNVEFVQQSGEVTFILVTETTAK